jgi:hypothetical protein
VLLQVGGVVEGTRGRSDLTEQASALHVGMEKRQRCGSGCEAVPNDVSGPDLTEIGVVGPSCDDWKSLSHGPRRRLNELVRRPGQLSGRTYARTA